MTGEEREDDVQRQFDEHEDIHHDETPGVNDNTCWDDVAKAEPNPIPQEDMPASVEPSQDDDSVLKVGIPDDVLKTVDDMRSIDGFDNITKAKAVWYKFAAGPGNLGMMRMVFYDRFHEVPSILQVESSYTKRVYRFPDGGTVENGVKVDVYETFRTIVKHFGKGSLRVLSVGMFGDETVLLGPGFLVDVDPAAVTVMFLPKASGAARKIVETVAWNNSQRNKCTVKYLVYSDHFHAMTMEVKRQETDVGMNYNDDLPDERIREWIASDESGLMIMHGIPGTGKTSYIRHLIATTGKTFMFFDKSVFHHMTDASLMRLLLDFKDSVIILEDCEDLLANRQDIGSCMSTILNMTDGILGDSLRFKFVCTFNANIVDIDPAILRKGRMRLKYEFCKLKADKAVALGRKLGVEVPHEDMPLCDIYNYLQDVGNTKKETKMGF